MKRRRQQPDSLELLLDTMCNTFGGIIMIALLIALLTRDASSDDATQKSESILRQIHSIEQQTAEAEQLRRRLIQSADPATSATLQLLSERDLLRTQIQTIRQLVESNKTTVAYVPAVDPDEILRLESEIQSKTNELKTLAQQIERDSQLRRRSLRLPRERATSKKNFYLIVRHAKIYPVYIVRDGELDRNTQSISWTERGDSDTATPLRDLGFDATTGLPSLARLFNEISPQTYSVHFLVYDDSFPAFLAARQIPLGRNYDTGWEFMTDDRPVVFSPHGEAPPAL